MKTKLFIILPLVILLTALGVWVINMPKSGEVNSLNKYPDLIQVDEPSVNEIISSPLTVTGKARGNWYFEASFPIHLLDANGNELGVIPAEAQSEWMTENFVPFKAILTFSTPLTETGTLILENDNPSGAPENSKRIEIPVRFSNYKSARSVEFDKPITARVDDGIVFNDGLLLSVKSINDSRCKSGVVCVWQGELATVLAAVHGKFDATTQDIHLGTVNNKNLITHGYKFSLESATESTITIIVSPTSGNTISSGVNGYVHMGPTCPVEMYPPDPNCADKPYANADVNIRVKSSGIKVNGFKSDAGGNFHASLSPETYVITVGPQANGYLPRCGESEATVVENKFTSVDISCDTGIR